MNNPGTTWKRHLLAIGFRCACMAAITITGPLVGVDTQPERPDGSEQAPGVAGLLFVAGVVAAVVFALIASSVHWFLRRRPLQTILLAEALLAAAFIGFVARSTAQAKSRPTPAGKTAAALPFRSRLTAAPMPGAGHGKFGGVFRKGRVAEAGGWARVSVVGRTVSDRA